ncbi:MAG: nucleoside phosphorylase [Planctomycetota bacterium]
MSARQYHINLKRGEAAPNIIFCGDPDRTDRIARLFDRVTLKRQNREFQTYTGLYKNIPVSVMSTGIGPANVEIALIELSQIADDLTIIRVGSCGSLQKNIHVGDVVISTASLRLENTSLFFVPEGYPAIAHYEVIQRLKESAEMLGMTHHLGLTATAPGFYGAQGRVMPGFPLRTTDMVNYFSKIGVMNFEMETSVLLTLGHLKNYRVGSVSAVYADRCRYKFATPAEQHQAETNCIKTGLKAMELLCS